MKTFLNVISFLVLISFFNSCTEAEEELSKAKALELFKICQAERPVQDTQIITLGEASYSPRGSSLVMLNYLKMLKNTGAITLDFLSTDASNYSIFKTTIPEINNKYVIEVKQHTATLITSATVIKTYREIDEVINVTITSPKTGDVTVKFNKIKTPFYDALKDNTFFKGKPDSYIEVLKFRKGINGWAFCN